MYKQRNHARSSVCLLLLCIHEQSVLQPRDSPPPHTPRFPPVLAVYVCCLPALCPLSCRVDVCRTSTHSEIVERVLCKASRTTSGSDSYFTVEQLFTNSDYLLKPRAERLPPINVEVRNQKHPDSPKPGGAGSKQGVRRQACCWLTAPHPGILSCITIVTSTTLHDAKHTILEQ